MARNALLIFGGPLTAVPLAMFAAGARRIRLSTIGFLQYLSPSITLLLAIFGFGESFTRVDGVAFGIVWLALVIVALEGPLMRLRTAPSLR
jgi:chloramphenicol-sensitive protein RarD